MFFSKDLFARYFTYAKNGESHFILFDDADTRGKSCVLGGSWAAAAFSSGRRSVISLTRFFAGDKKYRTSRCGTFLIS